MKKILSFILIFALSAGLFGMYLYDASGSTMDDLRRQKKEQEEKKQQLENKAANAQEYIKDMDSKITDISQKLHKTSTDLDNTQKEITVTKKKLEEAQESVKLQYSDMKLRIKYMYENGDTQLIDLLLNSGSITEFLNKAEYITELSQYDREMLDKFKKTRKTIADSKEKLEKDEKSLLALQQKQQSEKSNLESLSESKKGELAKYEEGIHQAEASAADIDKEMAAQQAAIEKAMAAEKARAEAARKAQEAQRQQSNNTSSNTQSSGGSTTPSGSGNWGWPLPGHTSISSGYGERWGSFHHGIDIPAPAGTPIVAAESGTVAWANYSSSAGNWVGIAHSNGATSVYMHMSSSCVSAGQTVSRGQVIGYVGNTGASQGNHLHFSVKIGGITGSWVNPWNYL